MTSHCPWTRIQTAYQGAQGQSDLSPDPPFSLRFLPPSLSLPLLQLHIHPFRSTHARPVCPQIHSSSFPVSSFVSAGFWLGLAHGKHWEKPKGARRIKARYLLLPSLPWKHLHSHGLSSLAHFPLKRPPRFRLPHPGCQQRHLLPLPLQPTVAAASYGL